MSSARTPGYLDPDLDDPADRIRCPIHGFIRFSQNERRVIDHRLFRRLRHIRQLALTEYVYPGATHSRFEHSFGVMEVVTRLFESLCAKKGDLLESVLGEDPRFKGRELAYARQALRLAALCHDTGHAPFSHAVEHFAHADADHETLSIWIASTPDLLGGLIGEIWGEEMPSLVASLLSGKDLPPQLSILRQLVSSQLDGDRMDYLLRDSYHCGVEYGRFDHRRLIESLDMVGGTKEGLETAISRDGIHTLEAMVLARYQLFTQVLHHRLRRLYDYYLLEYFRALGDDAPRTPEAILATNDIKMISRIFDDADARTDAAGDWARRIRDRRHHKLIFETGMSANATDLKALKVVQQELENKYTNVYRDVAEGFVHKLLQPADTEEKAGVELMMTRRSGRPILVTEESNILRNMPRLYKCGRIYSDVESENQRKDMQELAIAMYRDNGGH